MAKCRSQADWAYAIQLLETIVNDGFVKFLQMHSSLSLDQDPRRLVTFSELFLLRTVLDVVLGKLIHYSLVNPFPGEAIFDHQTTLVARLLRELNDAGFELVRIHPAMILDDGPDFVWLIQRQLVTPAIHSWYLPDGEMPLVKIPESMMFFIPQWPVDVNPNAIYQDLETNDFQNE